MATIVPTPVTKSTTKTTTATGTGGRVVDSRSSLDSSPLMSFKFRVRITKPSSTVITLDDMGFTSVSGLAVQIPPFPF